MVQGAIKKSNAPNMRKKREPAPKKKNQKIYADNDVAKEKDEVSRKIVKKLKEHTKKIYKSIEQTIIDKAKQYRENFEIL